MQIRKNICNQQSTEHMKYFCNCKMSKSHEKTIHKHNVPYHLKMSDLTKEIQIKIMKYIFFTSKLAKLKFMDKASV